jgi:hypothetical protein
MPGGSRERIGGKELAVPPSGFEPQIPEGGHRLQVVLDEARPPVALDRGEHLQHRPSGQPALDAVDAATHLSDLDQFGQPERRVGTSQLIDQLLPA